jgi:anti-sigma regulatory factor (Ser/Thr protein kinase)
MITHRTFAREMRSVPRARQFVKASIADVSDDTTERAALLVSELATNAIQHAHTDFVVRIEQAADEVRVEVADTGGGTPELQLADPHATSGRGLRIVNALADTWGVDPSAMGTGKTVWFRIAVP